MYTFGKLNKSVDKTKNLKGVNVRDCSHAMMMHICQHTYSQCPGGVWEDKVKVTSTGAS